MIRRSTKILFEVFLGAVALIVAASGIFFWRLTQGPLVLDILTPQLEAVLTDEENNRKVDIGTTVLAWDGSERAVDVEVRGLVLSESSGRPILSLPQAAFSLSLRALAQGVVAPTRITIDYAGLTLVRDRDGTFDIAAITATRVPGETAKPSGNLVDELPILIDELLAPPSVSDPLSFLRTVVVRNASVEVEDRRLGGTWRAPRASIRLDREGGELSAEASLELVFEDRSADVDFDLRYSPQNRRIDFNAQIFDFEPAGLASFSDQFEMLAGARLPLNGRLTGALDPTGVLLEMRVEIAGSNGTLSLPEIWPEPVAVNEFILSAELGGERRALLLKEATLGFGSEGDLGPRFVLAGVLDSSGERLRLGLGGRGTGISLEDLGRYWPLELAPNARTWVTENIPLGIVDEMELDLGMLSPSGRFDGLQLISFGGALSYRDLEIHFLRPMPPVETVTGVATFDEQGVYFTADAGLGQLRVKSARVDIYDLHTTDQRLGIQTLVRGPLRDTLELLDHERLQLLEPLGIDPVTSSGDAEVKFSIDFPLLNDLTFADMELGATAKLANIGLEKIVLDRDLSEGDFDLDLDKTGMTVTGQGKLAGVPAEAVWREDFTGKKKLRTEIDAKIPRFDSADRAAFGWNLAPYIEGPLSGSLEARFARDKTARLEVQADIGQAALALEDIGWRKAAGVPGSMTASLDLVDGSLSALPAFALKTDGAAVGGSGLFDEAGRGLRRLDLATATFGRNELNGLSLEWREDLLSARVEGGILDLQPFLEETESNSAAPESIEPLAVTDPVFSPLTLAGNGISRVWLGEKNYVERTSFDLQRSRTGWEKVVLYGEIPRSFWHHPKAKLPSDGDGEPAVKRFDLRFARGADGLFDLDASADDFGAFMRAFDLSDTIEGGTLKLKGTSAGPLPMGPLEGRLSAREFRIFDAPVLARLLTVASLTGIGDLMSGDGIQFDRMIGDFTLAKHRLSTPLARAYGPAIGLTAEGSVDLEKDLLDLEGTVVPAYSINRILGKVPIIGQLLVGEGLLAVTYRIDGALSDPNVSVNPLSALTPNFLRGLFGVGGSGARGDDAVSDDGETPPATLYPENVGR